MSARRPLRVAFLGPVKSFSYAAARLRFGRRGVRYLPAPDIPRAVESVLDGEADVALVPIENTTGGMIGDTLDSILNGPLAERGVSILEECHLDIQLALLGRAGGAIRRVYSHEVPLKHCRPWLLLHLPGVALEKVSSTSRAVALAARRRDAAAVASPEAARRSGLKILRCPLIPERPNRTSFYLLGRADRRPPSRPAKVAIALSLSHRPGSLYRALGVLAKHRLNMTRIESRPLLGRPWEYVFFIEVEGRLGTAPVRAALDRLRRQAHAVQVMGNYAVRHLAPSARRGGPAAP